MDYQEELEKKAFIEQEKNRNDLICIIRDSETKVDFSRMEITINDEEVKLPDKINGDKPWKFLQLLFENNKRTVSYEYINGLSGIWGWNGRDDNTDHIKSIRTWASSFNNVFPCKIIESVKNVGYRINCKYEKYTNEEYEEEFNNNKWLTKKLPPNITDVQIIHREKEINDLKDLISKGICKILISGFGAIGKTSILNLLFCKIRDLFQSVGWVEYNGNCRKSLLSDLTLFADVKDQDERWGLIEKHLLNDSSKKLLVIDNVDIDVRKGQNPLKDDELKALGTLPNLTVVLTSRIDSIENYHTYYVGGLGSDSHKEENNCLDLFYLYYKEDELKKPIKKRLYYNEALQIIKNAQYHTYLIELLAKGAKDFSDIQESPDLKNYVDLIKEKGISFPDAVFHSSYDNTDAYTTVSKQIQRLFDPESRTSEECQILWDFAALPEIVLSVDQVKEWLGYDRWDWTALKDQGWLLCRNGLTMHPLVKESFRLSVPDGLAPRGTLKKLIGLALNKKYIQKIDSINDVYKKVSVLESIVESVDLDTTTKFNLHIEIGYVLFKYLKRLELSEHVLREALDESLFVPVSDDDEKYSNKATVLFQIGYVRSATLDKRNLALKDLLECSKILENLYNRNKSKYCYRLALCYDHLGYVMTDRPEKFEEAERTLKRALSLWNDLKEANDQDYSCEIATTEDNLGFLYTKWGKTKDAEKFYLKSLDKRELLYSSDISHRDELAWTLHNLGDLYSQFKSTYKDAKDCYERALVLRIEHNKQFEGTGEKNIAWTKVCLGALMAKLGDLDKAKELNDNVKTILEKYDSVSKSFFVRDIIRQSEELSAAIETKKKL